MTKGAVVAVGFVVGAVTFWSAWFLYLHHFQDNENLVGIVAGAICITSVSLWPLHRRRFAVGVVLGLALAFASWFTFGVLLYTSGGSTKFPG